MPVHTCTAGGADSWSIRSTDPGSCSQAAHGKMHWAGAAACGVRWQWLGMGQVVCATHLRVILQAAGDHQ